MTQNNFKESKNPRDIHSLLFLSYETIHESSLSHTILTHLKFNLI